MKGKSRKALDHICVGIITSFNKKAIVRHRRSCHDSKGILVTGSFYEQISTASIKYLQCEGVLVVFCDRKMD